MQKYRVLSSFLLVSDKTYLIVLTGGCLNQKIVGTRHMGRPFEKIVHLNEMRVVMQQSFLHTLFIGFS